LEPILNILYYLEVDFFFNKEVIWLLLLS